MATTTQTPSLQDILAQQYDVSLPTTAYNNAGTGGQYGYYQGLPVLKASEADKVINQFGGYVQGNQADKLDNAMGWDTGSLSGILTSGAGVFGLRKIPEMRDEGENSVPTGSYRYTGDFNAAAKQLGIDPNQYKDVYGTRMRLVDSDSGTYEPEKYVVQSKESQLYDAINNASKDLYLVAGKTGTGAINAQGERPAFGTNTQGNHAAVLYKKTGDALVPIPESVKYFNAEMELSPGSFLKDLAGGLAPIASMFAAASGNPMLAAAIQGTNSVVQGNSVLDAAKAAALTYGASTLGGEAGAATKAATDSSILGNIATGATSAGTKAALTGGDIGSAALTGGIVGGVNAGIKEIPSALNSIDISSGLSPDGYGTNFGMSDQLASDLGLSGESGWDTSGASGDVLAGLDTVGDGTNFGMSDQLASDLGLSGESGLNTEGASGDVLAGLDTVGDGSNFGMSDQLASELGLSGESGLTTEGASGDVLAGLDTVGDGSFGEEPNGYASTPETNPETTTYDDGSTLVTDPVSGEVISGTDADGNVFTVDGGVATYVDSGLPLSGTPETNFGGNLADPNDVQKLLDYNASVATDKTPTVKVPTTPTVTSTTTPTSSTPATSSGLNSLSNSSQNIANLTAGVTGGKGQVELQGIPKFPTGGSVSSSNYIQDLGSSSSSYDPYGAPTAGSLKAGLTGGKGGAKLTGLPGYLIRVASGGSIPEGHNPQFFSEGGLNSMNNQFVKGAGDGTSDSVPAMLASGEFVIPADVVSNLGNGSNDAGAKILNEFMSTIRAHKQKHDSKKLPPDSKGPLAYLLQANKQLGKK